MGGLSKTMHSLKQRIWYTGPDSHPWLGCSMAQLSVVCLSSRAKRVWYQVSVCETGKEKVALGRDVLRLLRLSLLSIIPSMALIH